MTLDAITKYNNQFRELEQEFEKLDKTDQFAFAAFYPKFVPVYTFAMGIFGILKSDREPSKGMISYEGVYIPSKDELTPHMNEALSLAGRVNAFADRLEEVANVFRNKPDTPEENIKFLFSLLNRYGPKMQQAAPAPQPAPSAPRRKPGVSFMKNTGFFK